MAFKNIYNVSRIENYHDVVAYCPLGKDYYSATVKVIVTEPQQIPDYLDSDSFIQSLSSKELIIEDLAYRIAAYFKDETYADKVSVDAYVQNAAHSPVDVMVTL